MAGREHASVAVEARMLARRRPLVLCLFVLALAVVAGLAGLLAATAQAQEAREYRFTKVVDSVEDGFDPSPSPIGCAAINNRGAIAFRAGRLADDGVNTTPGVYRVNADGRLVTVVEDDRFDFIGFNPSINNSGQVSFAATQDDEDSTELILRGRNENEGLTTIASTAGRFNFFGFDTSINRDGVVAFKAELDERFGFDEGLFSGNGDRITTHYLASTSRFDGTDSRPSINDAGEIAFEERSGGNQGIFVTRNRGFATIAMADPDGFVSTPVLNDEGTVAFHTSFTDEASGEPVTEILKGTRGNLDRVADTRGRFAFFGSRAPALNNEGDVAFEATLDDFTTTGIFVGPNATRDRVIATGDRLDGSRVRDLLVCEEGLNDSGQLAFRASLDDPDSPEGFREAIFRATPRP